MTAPMTMFIFIVAIMASFRLAYAIAKEEGPFSLFSWIRGKVDPNQRTWIGRGLNCGACVSVWTSLVVVIAVMFIPGDVLTLIVFWLAVACGALVINKWVNR